MWRNFSYYATTLYILATRCIICTANICMGIQLAGTAHLSTVKLDEIASKLFKKTFQDSNTTSTPTKSNPGFRNCRANKYMNDNRNTKYHSKSFLKSTKWTCCGSCKKTFAASNISAKVSTTSSLASQKFATTYIIQLMSFCSGCGIIFLPKNPDTGGTIAHPVKLVEYYSSHPSTTGK